jgi:hypothetical protein
MKLKTILSTLFLIAVGVQSYADNVLTASDVSIQAGQTATLNITLSDEGPSYNAFVFDLLLPEGISIATSSEDGQYIATYNSERAKGSDYQLLIANHKAHSYRVLGFNQTNESFGSKGVLLTITLQAATDITNGNATGILVTDFTDQEYGSSVLGFVATDNYWTYGFPQASFTVSMTNDTGIHDLQADDAEANTYNLMGQRVQHADKGVFIKNGKKIIKK